MIKKSFGGGAYLRWALLQSGWSASLSSCLSSKVGLLLLAVEGWQLLLSKELISFSELMLYLSTKNRVELLIKPLL
jgi:hypothetical protein